MAFPSAPTNGQIYNDGTYTYTYVSSIGAWKKNLTVPAASTITITGASSITGGGDLTASRSLSLVNDVPTPGNSMMYGTNSTGVKGWYAAPAPLNTLNFITVNGGNATVAINGFANFTQASTNGTIAQTNGTSPNFSGLTLSANRRYCISSSINGGSYVWAIADRTTNAILMSFNNAISFIYTPSANQNIGLLNTHTAAQSGVNFTLSVYTID